jgi:hypothetical protein
MPLTDAQHIQRLKTGFTGLELDISNAPEFQGVAIAEAGPILFQSFPVTKGYMQQCADGHLAKAIQTLKSPSSLKKTQQHESTSMEKARSTTDEQAETPTTEDRLARLMRQRQAMIQSVALPTMEAWKHDGVEARGQGVLEDE